MRCSGEAGRLERLSATHAQPVNTMNVSAISTIMVPVLNERDKIEPLLALLDIAMQI